MAYSPSLIEKMWIKADPQQGVDHKMWRKDFAGAWIRKDQFGLHTEYGWGIDHIMPRSMGGGDEERNLQPIHWRNNLSKMDKYPEFRTIVSSNGNRNILKEQLWRATD